jgi:ribosomal protein L11 methyltransferase
MNWIEIKIKTSTEAVDAVSNIFYEAGATGVVIEDPKDYIRPRNEDEQVWDYMDIPENLDPEEAVVTAYLLEDSSIVERAREIQTRIRELVKYGLEIGKAEMVLATVSDTDWDEAWKKYYKPTHVGQNIVIKPSWEDYTQKDNEVVIELDPGMAFGTGTHETTALCLEMLEQHIKHGCAVIDVGCGSGVLSIAAAKLGASRVFAIDKDEVAVEAAIKNAKRNRVDSILQVVKGNKLRIISVVRLISLWQIL